MSINEAGISNTIPLVFLLDHTLHDVMDWALEAQYKEEEEDFMLSQSQQVILSTASIPLAQGRLGCWKRKWGRFSGGNFTHQRAVCGWGETMEDTQ